MNQALVGRGIAAVGVVLGFVAIFVSYASIGGSSGKYSDDGTILAFLLVALIACAVLMAASMGGRDDLEAAAAVAGGAAFGFYLLIPASLGFNHFDIVDTGGWLGVCCGLIPLGLWYSLSSRPTPVLNKPSPVMAVPIIVGRICCLVAIWVAADTIGGETRAKLLALGFVEKVLERVRAAPRRELFAAPAIEREADAIARRLEKQ